jgi:hypothetical protein
VPTLARARLSNHIGVDVLTIEPERILLVRQSARNTLSQGLLAPSGSGSGDWSDTRHKKNLLDIVKAGMIREMAEELGLAGAAKPGLPDVRVIGYARLTHLGGKPQFYGVCRLEPIRERVRFTEERYIDDFCEVDIGPSPTRSSLLAVIENFTEKHAAEMSFPLFVNLAKAPG